MSLCDAVVALRDAVLVHGLQGAVAVLCGGLLVHVAEALHGGDVALDALLWNIQLGNKGQGPAVIETEQHWAAVMALQQTRGPKSEFNSAKHS